MRILVACEESQRVTLELRKLGHEAYSCDLIPCSGHYPHWHLRVDVLELLKLKWDMIIAFPPCTYLTVSANKWYKDQPPRKSGVLVGEARRQAREEAVNFFLSLVNADCPKIAVENPIGVMSSRFRKPDQIIQPYNFGTDVSKSTCLWLKGLPKLKGEDYIPPRILASGAKRWGNQVGGNGSDNTPVGPNRAKIRSKTHLGVAKAMALQWGGDIRL